MASSQNTADHGKKNGEADASAHHERGDAGPTGVKRTVEKAARLYYDFCKKAARTISRLKRENE